MAYSWELVTENNVSASMGYYSTAYDQIYTQEELLSVGVDDATNSYGLIKTYISEYGGYNSSKVLIHKMDANVYEYRLVITDVSRQGSGNYYKVGDIIALPGTFRIKANYGDINYVYAKLERRRKNQAPTTPGIFTAPTGGAILKGGQSITITHGVSTDIDSDPITYEAEVSYNNGVFSNIRSASGNSFSFSLPTDKTKTSVQFRVRAKDPSGEYSAYQTSSIYTIKHNTAPTLTLNIADKQTLYEKDSFVIDGSALDTDNGNIVNVKYSINGGTVRAIATAISTGVAIPFNKQLTFKNEKLYEGETVLTDALAAGVAHILKIWAEDDQGGKSADQIRTFYVVPNRAPAITVNPIEVTGIIDSDKFSISGTCSDPDENDVIVTYKINESLSTEIHRGQGGNWNFDVSLGSLKVGDNTIIVEVTDSFNFKTSKTIKLNKVKNETPLLSSVARYKITPPSGSAKGVLLWIQREKGLSLSAEISMKMNGEQETYVPMKLENTAPVSQQIVEDEFIYQSDTAKENIIVKLNLNRESVEVSDSITLISGVLS